MSQRSTPSTDNIKLAAIPESILTASPSSRLHRFRDWISDRFSSIMVKEARQALKSYQFFITYTIVIFAVAAWTLLMFFGDTVSSYSANWDELSKNLFFGYGVILGVPLCLIVPFSAFRSLAREYEDGTIQLISITTMKPYQIVLGKLSTAMLQMAIYLSIIAPCIALTYMLDGISYALIGIVLLIATGGSIFLTILGLLLAGASRSYAIGMGISVFFVLGLGGLYLSWLGLLSGMIHEYGFNANEFLRPDGQIAIYGTTACLGSIALVMLAAAAAQISFDSDNRSTTIRIAMLVQMTLFLGLVAMIASIDSSLEILLVLVIAVFAGHFWLIAGCMLVSEKLGLSDRVQRTLPKTWFGRSFFSLLLPGPGRGYLFTVSCLIATVLASAAIIMSTNWYAMPSSFSLYSRPFQQAWIEALGASAIASLYPLFFLSLVYLWMYLLRRNGRLKTTGALGPFIGLLSGILFVSSISILAFALCFERPLGTNYYSSSEPSIFRCFNWYLAISDLLFSTGSVLRVSNLIFFLPFLIVAAATTLTATLIAIRELRYQPTAAPIRVIEEVERDEAERYAVPAAPAGESIDEIFGALPDKKPPTDAE